MQRHIGQALHIYALSVVSGSLPADSGISDFNGRLIVKCGQKRNDAVCRLFFLFTVFRG